MEYIFLDDGKRREILRVTIATMKRNDIAATILAVTGAIFAQISLDISMNIHSIRIFDTGIFVISSRAIVTMTTIFLVCLIFRRYWYELKYDQIRDMADIQDQICTGRRGKYLILEVLVNMLHSPPMADFVLEMPEQEGTSLYSLDLLLTLCTLFRFYWIFRMYFFYSYWNNEKSEKICNENSTFGGVPFAIKCEMENKPYRLLILAAITSVIFFGLAIRTCEYPYMAKSG